MCGAEAPSAAADAPCTFDWHTGIGAGAATPSPTIELPSWDELVAPSEAAKREAKASKKRWWQL
jgi:hypothetical protein